MTETTARPTTDDCPDWCDYSWPSERHTHTSNLSDEMELAESNYRNGGGALVPTVVALTLIREGLEQPTICLDRNEKPVGAFTLDEAEAFGQWILRLVETGRGTDSGADHLALDEKGKSAAPGVGRGGALRRSEVCHYGAQPWDTEQLSPSM